MLRFPSDVVHEIVGKCHSVDAKLGLYKEPSDAGGSHLDMEEINEVLGSMGIVQTESGMLSNGGRLYMDPSGPEYDTAEHASAEEAVHATFNGDTIMYRLLGALVNREAIDGFQLNRRIVDHNRSSRGIHLNTSTTLPERLTDDEYQRIAALQVVKGSLFGSGGLMVDDNGKTEFHHSPRLSLTNTLAASYAQYTLRPLVRTDFKQDAGGLRRIETVSGDALNFAWPLRASMVVTNAITRLLEMRRFGGLPRLASPIDAAHVVGKYGNGYKISMLNKQNEQVVRFPSEILSDICETALAVDTTEDYLDDESHQVLQEIIDVADKIKQDPMSVATQVESIARWRAMQRKMAKDRLDLGSERMCGYDYYWDLIGGGLAENLRNKKLVGWDGFSSTRSANPSKKQLVMPPSNTRAYVRGEYIKNSGPGNNSNWVVIEDKIGDNYELMPLDSKIPGEVT